MFFQDHYSNYINFTSFVLQSFIAYATTSIVTIKPEGGCHRRHDQARKRSNPRRTSAKDEEKYYDRKAIASTIFPNITIKRE